MLSKLSQGADLIALEAKYHANCLVQFYKRADSVTDAADKNEHEICPESIAVAELVVSIEDSSDIVFKLADLAKSYESHLEELWHSSTFSVVHKYSIFQSKNFPFQ